MNTVLMAIAAFLAGIIAGLEAPRLLRFRRGRGDEAETQRAAPDESAIGALSRKMNDLKDVLERVLEDLNTLSEKVSRLSAPAALPADQGRSDFFSGGPRNRTPDEAGRAPAARAQDFSRRDPFDVHTRPASLRPEPSTLASGHDALGFDPVSNPPGEPERWERGSVAPAGPPPNALNVEARDDRIVATASFPPEAWLAVVAGSADASVTLNPAVRLNEYALQRLSTFFEWDARRPDATYHTVQPATVKWDDGARVGVLVSRGRAQPR